MKHLHYTHKHNTNQRK